MQSKQKGQLTPTQQQNAKMAATEPWLPIKTTFLQRLPFSGEGVVSANISRRTPFVICIQPTDDEAHEKGFVEVLIIGPGAFFISERPQSEGELGPFIFDPKAGLEDGKKVSYWFSFNRDDRVLKYGKGYVMEQTTLLTKSFPFPEQEGDSDPWGFIFRPDTTKEIVIKDFLPIESLAALEDPRQSGTLLSLSPVDMQTQAVHAYRSMSHAEQMKLKAVVDVEKSVSFCRHPLTSNWSPLVLDSSKTTLDILSTNDFTMSANLPAACRELYENIAPPGLALDWPFSNPRLSDAISYSINNEGKILFNKLKEKVDKGDFKYLRVTVGIDRGSSPGIPYVLEIWPPNSASPIHNHGNAYAVIKVLHGEIKVTIYNKTWNDEEAQEELMNFTAIQGDVTWLSPNWFQTHKLTNESNQLFCATIQCYKYGFEDELMWPYFDYLDGKDVKEFLPDCDFEFTKMREDLLQEYRHNHGLYTPVKNY